MKAYSYVRFSTGDQIKGDSLRRQTEATAEWCKRNKAELVDSYRDLGVSAFRGKNAETGALNTFLKLARAGRIEKGSYLVVESLDRISRNDILDAFELFLSIIRSGIVVVTLTDGHVYDKTKINNGNFSDLIISLTVLSRANEESKTKSSRLAAAWANKRRHMGETKITARCVGWLKLSADRRTFEPITDRAKVVRRIFELARAGSGANQIGKILRRENTRPFGKAPVWHTSYVKKILDNRAVIGEFAPAIRRGGTCRYLDPIPGYYPAVVSKELFATVQQMKKARPSYRGKSGFNVFSKLAFDRETGSTMAYVNKNRAKGWHYLLSNAALVQQAKYSAWAYDDFLASFLTVCEEAALAKAEPVSKDNGELAVKRMELADTEAQIARLVEFLAKGISGSVETKLRDLEAGKGQIQARIADLENEMAAAPADVSKVDWKDNDALRENLRATVKRITIDAAKRWFKAEFFDGRVYEFKRDADRVIITRPD